MRILLVGSGSGGHFYPLIAIAEEINRISDEERLTQCYLYHMADKPFDIKALDEQFITFIPITAGKVRMYFSWLTVVDILKTPFAIFQSMIKVYNLYPDVIISKGGYASFPVLVAAWFLRIPVIIHESDTVPGRVNVWSGKFAKRIALSYPEAARYFDASKVSMTGQPIRRIVSQSVPEGAKEFFDLDPSVLTVGVIGGSQGAKVINDVITTLLPEMVQKYQIIHQTGTRNFEDVKTDAQVVLDGVQHRNRYKAYAFFNDLQTKMFGAASDVVISRAGSALFEIAAWGKPSIIIPIPESNSHGDHQRKNAYHYARTGACTVIEQENLTPSVLRHGIESILDHEDKYAVMTRHAKDFYTPNAARMIAAEAIRIAIGHER